MFDAGALRPRARRLAAVVLGTAILMGVSVERGFAQADFFDWYPEPASKQPSFLRLEADSWVPPPRASETRAVEPEAERSWLDPVPLGPVGNDGATFVRTEQPTTTGALGAEKPQTCPDPEPSAAPEPPKPEPDRSATETRSPTEKLVGRGPAVWYELPGNTASGESYDPEGFTAGHRTLPFGTRVRVVNEQNGRSAIVRINDRGPVQRKFVIDLSRGSAKFLGITGKATVSLFVVEPPPGPEASMVQSAR
jgi:rare lipoprotein A